MDNYVQGRKITDLQDCERPSPEVLHLIRKLRWMGLEEEAEAQIKLRVAAPTGGVITTAQETD